MKSNIHIKTIADISGGLQSDNSFRRTVDCSVLDAEAVRRYLSEPIFLNASTVILVLSGTSVLSANYKLHEIGPDTLILLSASHLFDFRNCSDDFQCIGLFVSRNFTDAMDSTDMVYKRMQYEVITFRKPVFALNRADTALLRKKLQTIDEAIDNTPHLYHKEVVLNNLFGFYLDLSNIIDRREKHAEEVGITRQESLMKRFIELLVSNYRKEHKVDFYASELHLSAHYLTLIVKRLTGQSVSDFIFEMLYGEARNLLTHSKLSIQQIAMELNFADQSSFGKFFKRKSGMSAADYRKRF